MGSNAANIAAHGAGTILIPNLPNLAITPAFSTSPAAPLASIYTNTFNAALAANIAGDAAAFPHTNFIEMDVFSAENYVLAHPSTFGLSNTTTPCVFVTACVTGSTATQDTYAFWDTVHPTMTGHRFFAALATEYLYYGNFGAPTGAEGEASIRHRNQAMDGATGNIQGRAFEPGSPSVTFAIYGDTSRTSARDGGVMPQVRDTGGGGAVTLNVPETEHFRWGVQLSGQQSNVKAGMLSFTDLSGGFDLYAGWRGGGGAFVNATAGGSIDQFTNINRVTAVAPLVNTATTNGWSGSAKLQAGWYFDAGGMAISPRVAANFDHGDVEAYTEQGALVREAIAQRAINASSGEATIRVESNGGGPLYAYLEAGYRDYFTYQADPVTVSLPNNTALPLSTDLGRPDGGVAVVDAGLSGHITSSISVGIAFQGRYSGTYQDSLGAIGARLKF
jgi:outer membrane lipase/esterase